jgi:hypothetical protein
LITGSARCDLLAQEGSPEPLNGKGVRLGATRCHPSSRLNVESRTTTRLAR